MSDYWLITIQAWIIGIGGIIFAIFHSEKMRQLKRLIPDPEVIVRLQAELMAAKLGSVVTDHLTFSIYETSMNSMYEQMSKETNKIKSELSVAAERLALEQQRVAALLKECEAYRADRDQRIATHQGQPT